MRDLRQTVISGAGAISPFGIGVEPLWQALCDGTTRFLPHAPACDDLPAIEPMLASVVEDFDARALLGRKGLRAVNEESRLLLVAVLQAQLSAGLNTGDYAPAQMGMFVGTQYAGLDDYLRFHVERLVWGLRRVSPTRGPNANFNAPAAHAAIRNHLQGPNLTFSSRSSGSLDAIGHAADWLAAGRVEMMVAGGVERFGVPIAQSLISAGRAAEQPPRPYDRRRHHPVPGEGAAVVILEAEAAAASRGAASLARIEQWSTAFDADDPAAALARCLGGVEADAVFSSANGDQQRDAQEASALAQTVDGLPICAVKGTTGEWSGASGALQTVVAAHALAAQKLPPTVGYRSHDPALPQLNVVTTATEMPLNRVVVTSLDASGHASALTLSRMPEGASRERG